MHEGMRGPDGWPDDVGWSVERSRHGDGDHVSMMRVLLVFRNSHFAPSAEPRKRPSQARSRETVDRILGEAARLFDEFGYQGVTTNHVAEAAGVSVGSLYQYFPNKDSLLVGLAERHLEEATPRLTELADTLRVDAPAAHELCARFITEIAALNSTDRLHPLLWTAPRTPALIARLDSLVNALIAEVAWHLERLGHPPDLTPIRARILVTAIDAAIHDIDPDADRSLHVTELTRLAELFVADPGQHPHPTATQAP